MIEKLFVASNNQGKIKEIKFILTDVVHVFLTPGELGITESPVEDGNTFNENANKKAEFYFKRTGFLTLSDDSGLDVDVLKGQPGVRSSRFAGENATDLENNMKLLTALENIPAEGRGAQFRCVMVLKGSGILKSAEGICRGRIAQSIRGDHGFGYDPVFQPEKYDKTFGELGADIKDKISHRRKALESIKEILSNI